MGKLKYSYLSGLLLCLSTIALGLLIKHENYKNERLDELIKITQNDCDNRVRHFVYSSYAWRYGSTDESYYMDSALASNLHIAIQLERDFSDSLQLIEDNIKIENRDKFKDEETKLIESNFKYYSHRYLLLMNKNASYKNEYNNLINNVVFSLRTQQSALSELKNIRINASQMFVTCSQQILNRIFNDSLNIQSHTVFTGNDNLIIEPGQHSEIQIVGFTYYPHQYFYVEIDKTKYYSKNGVCRIKRHCSKPGVQDIKGAIYVRAMDGHKLLFPFVSAYYVYPASLNPILYNE